MRNFGRGMWRRVGDFEKTPGFKEAEYLAFIEFQRMKQRQENINAYRKQILKSVNSINIADNVDNVDNEIVEESFKQKNVLVEFELSQAQSKDIELIEEESVKPMSPIVEEQEQIVEELVEEPIIVEEPKIDIKIINETVKNTKKYKRKNR